MSERDREILLLYRRRPRSPFARWSAVLLAALAAYSWLSGEFRPGELLSQRRLANLERFLGELVPYPLQGREFDLGVAARWAGEVLETRGWSAAGATLAMSVVAIVLAGLAALALCLPAARSLSAAEPYLPAPRPPGPARRALWWGVVAVTRAFLIFVRSIPEYVWAFLFLAMLGPTAWPAILALAIHNSGILGKLTAEVVENLDPGPVAALRGLGANRAQIAAAGIFPLVLPRFMLFFFYRWETCVREATVLGMLGIVSLGFWIVDARARNHYDEMVFFVLIGAAIVLVGDLVSALAREVVRRAGGGDPGPGRRDRLGSRGDPRAAAWRGTPIWSCSAAMSTTGACGSARWPRCSATGSTPSPSTP